MRPGADKLAGWIDHTLLRPEATEADVCRLCDEAARFRFCSVFVHPQHVAPVRARLEGTGVKIGSVAGFPFGTNPSAVKIHEAGAVLAAGAGEVDMVLNIGALKSRDDGFVFRDIAGTAAVCRAYGAVLKVILETCLLTDEEKVRACRLAAEAGAGFVKTSTGFQSGGATVEDVRLMSAAVRESGLGVKAAGGIRTYAQVCALIEAGATRIGTSCGAGIMQEALAAR